MVQVLSLLSTLLAVAASQTAIMTCLSLYSSVATAQQVAKDDVPLSQRAVESLVSDGDLVLGIIWQQTDTTISIVAERDWVKLHLADRHAVFLKQESQRLKPILNSYQTRFDQWIGALNNKPNQDALIKDLEAERDRILEENEGDALQRKRFILLSFDRKRVESIKKLPIHRKRIAALSWEYDLIDVSNRSTKDLTKALRSKNVDIKNGQFDLSSDMPAAALTEKQWTIRKRIYEFDFTGEVEFQGEGDQLFRVSEGVDLNQVLTKMLAGNQLNSLNQLGRDLGLPEFSQTPQRDWEDEVTKIADKDGFGTVLVKRIADSADPDLVSVEAILFVNLGEQRWEKVANVTGSSRLSMQSEDQMKLIREDPQVEAALDAVSKLGIGGNANLLDQAIRKGAATAAATKQASDKIQKIINQNSRLESPWTLD